MAQVQIDIEQRLAAIGRYEEAISKLKAEVALMRALQREEASSATQTSDTTIQGSALPINPNTINSIRQPPSVSKSCTSHLAQEAEDAVIADIARLFIDSSASHDTYSKAATEDSIPGIAQLPTTKQAGGVSNMTFTLYKYKCGHEIGPVPGQEPDTAQNYDGTTVRNHDGPCLGCWVLKSKKEKRSRQSYSSGKPLLVKEKSVAELFEDLDIDDEDKPSNVQIAPSPKAISDPSQEPSDLEEQSVAETLKSLVIGGVRPRSKPFVQMSTASTVSTRSHSGCSSLVKHFFDLPRELRDRVYLFAIAPGDVRIAPHVSSGRVKAEYHYPTDPRTKNCKPVTYGLFGVSKQVRQEAAWVFFKKNHIIVNADQGTAWWMQHFFYAQQSNPITLKLCRITMAFSLLRYLTSMSISFDVRDLRIEDVLKSSSHVVPALVVAGATPDSLKLRQVLKVHQQQIHESRHRGIYKCWAIALNSALRSKFLRHLQLDVTHCYCTSGCCRMAWWIAEGLGQLERYPASLKYIEIVGTKRIDDRASFVKALLQPTHADMKHRGEHVRNALGTVLKFKKFEVQSGALESLHLQDLDVRLEDEVVEICYDYCLGKKRKSGQGGDEGFGVVVRGRRL